MEDDPWIKTLIEQQQQQALIYQYTCKQTEGWNKSLPKLEFHFDTKSE